MQLLPAIAGLTCTDLTNVGKEQHTFAYHVSTRWHALAERVVMSAVPLVGHHSGQIWQQQHDNRREVLLRGLADKSGQFHCSCLEPILPVPVGRRRIDCAQSRRVTALEAFTAGDHLPHLASAWRAAGSPTLGQWAKKVLGADTATIAALPLCFEGVAATTRDMIHAHPRRMYETLVKHLEGQVDVFEAYYMEHLMAVAYGRVDRTGLVERD